MSKQKNIFIKNPKVQHLIEHIELIIGCLIAAISFNVFLIPNNIASGGVVGISIIINHLFKLEPAIIQWIINIPLLFIGLFLFGKKFALKTLLGSFILPLFIFITKNVPPLTLNPILATIYGGVGIGIGLGIVFKGNGSTGGLSILASIINNYTGMSIGNATMLMDSFVILIAAFVFNAEKALYALIVIFITSKAIDFIQLGFSYSKVAFVICNDVDEISAAILQELNRGLTKLSGFGGYTGGECTILMVVMNQSEVSTFKNLVKAKDPNAFIIISDTNEVLGQGFKFNDTYISKVK